MMPKELVHQIQLAAVTEKIPWDLVAAIVEKESGGNTWQTRFETRWSYFVDPQTYATKLGCSYLTEKNMQMISWGLGQVMGSVARELGFNGYLPQLCADPVLGLTFCCRKLKLLIDKYPTETDAISSYNQGVPFKESNGLYVNQEYVDGVCGNRLKYMAADWTQI